MQSTHTTYWFTSSLFDVEPDEDEQTNPRMYGRQLALWLRERLLPYGYPVEEVFGEDWGWCVMCQRDPYSLFIGCVNLRDYEYAQEGDPPPPKEQILWSVVTFSELSFFRYLFRRKPDVAAGKGKLEAQVREILQSEPAIRLVDESTADNWFAQFKG